MNWEDKESFLKYHARRVISKAFEFDAGHRLSKGYVGKCANLHGHRYKVLLEISMLELNQFDMITDFNDLKPFKELLDQTFDHKMLLWQGDSIFDFTTAHIPGVFRTEKNPTAEHIAEVILFMAQAQPEWGSFVSAVTVWETPNSFARVEVK